MADLMAVNREMNHLIVSNIEETSEQKSHREKIDDNKHYGQVVNSVKTFLGLSIIGWVRGEVSHVHARETN